MKKNLKFIFTTTWILLSRSYDAYCTNALTPDLSKEANPLVSIGGISSWTTLLGTLIIAYDWNKKLYKQYLMRTEL